EDQQQREGQQQAVGDLALVDEAQHQPVDEHRQCGHAQRRHQQGQPEWQGPQDDARVGQISPQHVQRPMGEIDDVQNAENDVQSDGGNEQQQADIQTVEQSQTDTPPYAPSVIAPPLCLPAGRGRRCLPANYRMDQSLQAGSTGGVIFSPSKNCTSVNERILSCVFMAPVRPQVGPMSAWLSPLRSVRVPVGAGMLKPERACAMALPSTLPAFSMAALYICTATYAPSAL